MDDLFDLDERAAIGIAKMRSRLRAPSLSPADFVDSIHARIPVVLPPSGPFMTHKLLYDATLSRHWPLDAVSYPWAVGQGADGFCSYSPTDALTADNIGFPIRDRDTGCPLLRALGQCAVRAAMPRISQPRNSALGAGLLSKHSA